MGVVWHGNYVKYLEDGRESFGEQYNLGYLDVFEQGLFTPLVKLDINYKNTVKYGDRICVETKYMNSDAAKIIFKYRIHKCDDSLEVLTAKSIQVFMDRKGELILTPPDFFIGWKKQWNIL